MTKAALLLLVAASVASGAYGGTLVSPPVIVPDANQLASCNATNSHTKSVEVTIEVIDGNGNTEDSITTIVSPGATSAWSMAGPGILGCRLRFKGSDKKIVGTLYLLDLNLPSAIKLVVPAR